MARRLTGTVASDKGDKTIVINIRSRHTHPVYKKQYTVNTRFMAHDEKNEAKVGDLVVIIESRPLSAGKRFRLDRIIERGGVRFEEAVATADIPDEVTGPAADKPEQPRKEEPKAEKPSEVQAKVRTPRTKKEAK